MRTAWPAPIATTWVPFVHAVCNHNEVCALLKRSLGPTPLSAESARGPVMAAFRRIRRVCARYGDARWGLRETAESYGGSLRRRYLEAERSLMLDGPISSKDYMLRAFLKAEKVQYFKLQKPRMIFPRSPRYNLMLASWLKPFEHWLWGNLKSVGTRGVPRSRVVAKGLSPRGRAGLIARKFSAIRDCVVFEVDGKAFEAHLDVWQLVQEHACYAAAYPGDRDLMRLLAKQLRNFGVTSCGVRFSRPGGRASGDYNTGMGNSLVMLAVVDAVMRIIGVSQFDSLVDGDNALIFIPRRDCQEVVQRFGPTALECSGHEMVLERPVDHLEGVRFGQSAPVRTQFGWTMVRDWRKVLSGGTSSHANLNEPKFAGRYLHGVALCEASLARGVPILGKWAESLRRNTERFGCAGVWDHLRDYQVLGVRLDGALSNTRYVEPSMGARESFCLAFGVPPDVQLAMERELEAGRVVVDLALPAEVPNYHDFLSGPGLLGLY